MFGNNDTGRGKMAHLGLPAFELHVKRTVAMPLNSIEMHWNKKLFRNRGIRKW